MAKKKTMAKAAPRKRNEQDLTRRNMLAAKREAALQHAEFSRRFDDLLARLEHLDERVKLLEELNTTPEGEDAP
jgi:hypothetical protein